MTKQLVQRIPQDVIEEVRSQSNIVNIIGQYVQLRKSGKNYSGLCPFHNEKTPSFTVNDEKQMFYCFGCGKGGNVFKFLEEVEGITFPEAVLKTADLSNVILPEKFKTANFGEAEGTNSTRYGQLIDLHEKAADLYHHILLNTKAGQEALQYLEKRGVTKEIIETFQIGFAPRERMLLQQIFKNDGVVDELQEASGLFLKKNEVELLDRFYQRIMFPIRNVQGKVIAFSGRVLATEDYYVQDMPKYLNSPETEIFNKRQVLFNLDKARPEIRKTNEVILFEGFMDVIAAWRSGVQNGLASMGTSLTEDQIQTIQRLSKKVLLCYDGDTAGIEATFRGIQLLSTAATLDIAIVSLPEALDPDDYLAKYGTESFRSIVHHGRETIFTFKMKYFAKTKNIKNEKDRLEYIQQMLTELLAIPSVVEQELYFEQLAEMTGISQDTLERQFQSMKKEIPSHQHNATRGQVRQYASTTVPIEKRKVIQLDQVEKAERQLVYRMLTETSIYEQIKTLEDFTFVHDIYQEIFLLFDSYRTGQSTFQVAEFLDFLQSDLLRNKVVEIMYLNIQEESSQQEITDCLKVIKNSSLIESLKQKKKKQMEARKIGNKEVESTLALEIVNLMKKLKNI